MAEFLEQRPALRAVVEIPDTEFGYTQSGLDIGQETYAAFASATAAGTHVCLRAVRPASIWAAIDDLGVSNLCGHPQSAWDALLPAARATLIARQGVAMVQAETPRIVDGEKSDVPWDGTTIGGSA